MPVTPGPLTDRLAQVVADIAVLFLGVTTALTTIAENTTEMRADLLYLLQSGDNTPRVRNIQSIVNEVYDLGGPRSNHATLRSLYSAIGDENSTLSIRRALFELADPSIVAGRNNIANLVAAIDKLLGVDSPDNENITSVYNELRSLNIAQGTYDQAGAPSVDRTAILLQQIASCICELNGKTPGLTLPPPGPPASVLGPAFGCAEGGTILWVLTPSSWVNSPVIGWHAAPSSLSSTAIQGGYSLTTVTENTSGQSVAVVAALGEAQTPLTCFLTGDNETTAINTVTRRELRRDTSEPNYYIESSAFYVDNVYKGSCRPSSVWSGTTTRRHWYYDAALPVGGSMPPNSNIYFYTMIVAPPPPPPADPCTDVLSNTGNLAFSEESATTSTFWEGAESVRYGNWAAYNPAFSGYIGIEGPNILVLPGPRWYRIEVQLDPSDTYVLVSVSGPEFSGIARAIEIDVNATNNIVTEYVFVPTGMQAKVTSALETLPPNVASYATRVSIGFCIDNPGS